MISRVTFFPHYCHLSSLDQLQSCILFTTCVSCSTVHCKVVRHILFWLYHWHSRNSEVNMCQSVCVHDCCLGYDFCKSMWFGIFNSSSFSLQVLSGANTTPFTCTQYPQKHAYKRRMLKEWGQNHISVDLMNSA